MDQLSLGVIARSRKENERRLAIHPLHVERIEAGLRRRIYLERGYGERFGVPDGQLAGYVAGLRTRDQLLADCEVILLPKPLPQDLGQMREGQVLWGWPHCIQNEEITQLGVDLRLTLIAFEAMNHWHDDGSFSLHVFHKNNELAGYCSVLHAMQLIGTTGEYGRPLRAGVISFGATGRGAVTALNACGVTGLRGASRGAAGEDQRQLPVKGCDDLLPAAAEQAGTAQHAPWHGNGPDSTWPFIPWRTADPSRRGHPGHMKRHLAAKPADQQDRRPRQTRCEKPDLANRCSCREIITGRQPRP